MIVVADTSPLLWLSRAGCLDVLRGLYGTVIVPRIVWEELVTARPCAPGVTSLTAADWIRIDERPFPTGADLGLDPGETAAILLAETIGAAVLLIDERAGREAAVARGLHVRGTVGVLVVARQRGLLGSVRAVIDEIRGQGFNVSQRPVDVALSQSGER